MKLVPILVNAECQIQMSIGTRKFKIKRHLLNPEGQRLRLDSANFGRRNIVS